MTSITYIKVFVMWLCQKNYLQMWTLEGKKVKESRFYKWYDLHKDQIWITMRILMNSIFSLKENAAKFCFNNLLML